MDQIINIDLPVSVVFFGSPGAGKSTLANMLLQEDLCSKNLFPMSDSAAGGNSEIIFSSTDVFAVYDTVGLCVTSKGKVSNKDAIKKVRSCFSATKLPLNYICYVIKKGRFTDADKNGFKEFQKIFKGGERNFVIIITNSDSKWVSENKETIRKYFGNHEIIAVDFPFNDDYDADIQKKKRKENAALLTNSLLSLGFECAPLDIYGSKVESKVKEIVDFVPIIGTAYKLISAGTYYILQNPQLAKKRLKEALEDIPKIFSKIPIRLLTN
ncbi:9511_t:CDS:1 [Dentiscutata erythropus]|uniref:9511_t:CDS:1 n=1 Tax=Dentiscutata erythropus TaxID=1348616 RepID=A0A9N9FSF1_9GLOM|nr:9511_t:CDS:1 [Dentiscutata erythropus]